MTIKEIISSCSNLDVGEQRSTAEDYSELVFFNKEMEEWQAKLNDILGSPLKPAGKEPSEEDNSISEEYGGIFANQILYKKDFEDVTILVMIWPWQDGEHVTLKIAAIKK